MLHEGYSAEGVRTCVELGLDADGTERALCLFYEGKVVELPWEVVTAVFERYAKEKDPTIEPSLGSPRVELGGGRALTHLRHLARYDVVARDYLILERPGRPPLVELSTSIAGALVHLAEASG